MFRFTGEPYDPSGLMFLRARYYDPSIGRFLTQDTLMGQLNNPLSQNLYVYCSNNPVLYVDPSGHLSICEAKNAYLNYVSGVAVAVDNNLIFGGAQAITGENPYSDTLAFKIGMVVGDAGSFIAGGVITAAGVAGEAGGLVLDATSVGAVAGVPLNVASAGAVTYGGAAMVRSGGNFS